MKKTFLIITAFLLFGCVHLPQGFETEKFAITDFSQIKTIDNACQCKTARLGGKILKAEAQANHTKIEVLSLPVSDYSAKPLLESQSNGRFIAYLKGFVDPEILKNQYITLTGQLKNSQQGKIDLADYSFPLLQVENYHLWRVGQEYEYFYEHRGFGPWRRIFAWPYPEIRLVYYLY